MIETKWIPVKPEPFKEAESQLAHYCFYQSPNYPISQILEIHEKESSAFFSLEYGMNFSSPVYLVCNECHSYLEIRPSEKAVKVCSSCEKVGAVGIKKSAVNVEATVEKWLLQVALYFNVNGVLLPLLLEEIMEHVFASSRSMDRTLAKYAK